MLRTNLSTRPFYNNRAVRVALAAGVLLVAAFTTFNVMQVAALNARSREMAERADAAERQTAELRRHAQQLRQSMNSVEVSATQAAAQQANHLIGRRVFSWTELFNVFERTLPAEVRIAAVEPQVDNDGRMLIAVTVLSRRPEDLSEFMDRLEDTGRFHDVLNRQDQPQDDGLTRSILQGYYQDIGTAPTAAAAEASESSDAAANQSPETPNGPPLPPQGER